MVNYSIYLSISKHRNAWMTDYGYMVEVTQQNAIVRLDNKLLTLLLFTTFLQVLHRHHILESVVQGVEHTPNRTANYICHAAMHAPSVALHTHPNASVARSYCCRRLGRPPYPHIYINIYWILLHLGTDYTWIFATSCACACAYPYCKNIQAISTMVTLTTFHRSAHSTLCLLCSVVKWCEVVYLYLICDALVSAIVIVVVYVVIVATPLRQWISNVHKVFFTRMRIKIMSEKDNVRQSLLVRWKATGNIYSRWKKKNRIEDK